MSVMRILWMWKVFNCLREKEYTRNKNYIKSGIYPKIETRSSNLLLCMKRRKLILLPAVVILNSPLKNITSPLGIFLFPFFFSHCATMEHKWKFNHEAGKCEYIYAVYKCFEMCFLCYTTKIRTTWECEESLISRNK